MLSFSRWTLFGFATITFLLVSGCGPGQGDISGKVTFESKQVVLGSVLVKGSDGVVKGGEITPEGTYKVEGIAAGKIILSVNSPDPAEYKVGLRKKDQKPPPPKDRSKWFAIPKDYGEFNTSGLTFDLRPGGNTFDIALKSK